VVSGELIVVMLIVLCASKINFLGFPLAVKDLLFVDDEIFKDIQEDVFKGDNINIKQHAQKMIEKGVKSPFDLLSRSSLLLHIAFAVPDSFEIVFPWSPERC